MAKPLSRLIKKISPKVNAAATAKAAQLLTEMNLAELRKVRSTTQIDIADALGTKQPNVAQLEKRDDVYISTLRSYLEALGGELEIIARFPDGSKVAINQFSEHHM